MTDGAFPAPMKALFMGRSERFKQIADQVFEDNGGMARLSDFAQSSDENYWKFIKDFYIRSFPKEVNVDITNTPEAALALIEEAAGDPELLEQKLRAIEAKFEEVSAFKEKLPEKTLEARYAEDEETDLF